VARPRRPEDPKQWPQPCGRCGGHYQVAVTWPDGRICIYCYQAAKRTTGQCSCGHQGVLPGRIGGRSACRACTGVEINVDCDGCGAETELYAQGLCWACTLAATVDQLLANPQTGEIAAELQPLAAALKSMSRANSGLTWIRQPHVQALLKQLALRPVISHEILDTLPAHRTRDYVRGLLVEHGVLPRREEHRARYEAWAAQALQRLPEGANRGIMRRYIRWHMLRRMEAMPSVGEGTFLRSKQTVTVAIDFLAWLDGRGRALGQVTQEDLDAWQAGGPTTREVVSRFVSWAAKARLMPGDLTVTPHRKGTSPRLDAALQQTAVQQVVHSDELPPRDRLAAILVVVFGQQIQDVVQLTWTDVTLTRDLATIKLGTTAAEWVYSHREEIVAWLAERYLDGEPALLDTARTWIRQNLPADIGEPPKTADLRQLLAGTGMLMAEGADLRFTHHTLAEYLAARTKAGRMTAGLCGQPGLMTLIDSGVEAAQETFVVFTLVLWGRAEGRLGGLLRHLLDGPPRQSLLAGRILGECGDTRPAEASEVIDRLMEMALGDAGVVFRDDFGDDPLHRRGKRDPDPLAAGPGAAFWLLGSIHGDSHMEAVLRGTAASGELAIETRTDAAVALGRSSDRDGAVEILRSLAEDHTSPAARARIAEAIIVLDSDAADAAEAVLRPVTAGTGGHGPAVRAAELLAELGAPERAVDLAWSVISENDGAYPAQTISAIRIILRYQGADGAAGLLHVAGGQLSKARPMLRWILIELTQWGSGDHVTRFCRQALADPGTIQWQWSSVAGGWAFAAGPPAVPEIFRVLGQRGTRYDEAAGEISLRLLETGHPDEAFEIAMGLMQSPKGRPGYSHAPWIALAAAPSQRLPEVLPLIDNVSVSDDYNGQRVLGELIRLGETGRALSQAKALVLGSYGFSQGARPAILKVLRASGEAEALAGELVRAAAGGKHTTRKVPVIEALLELGDAKHAAEMAREVIANQTLLGNHLARMARVITLSEGLHAADGIVTLVREKEDRLKDMHLLEVADCLASAGALAAGTRLWLELLTSLSAPIAQSFASCSSLAQSGQRMLAITTLRDKLNDGDLPAAGRARLGALLSWAELRDPRENAPVSDDFPR
jgi:integrase